MRNQLHFLRGLTGMIDTFIMLQVHLFVQMDGAALDALDLQLPLFQAFGDCIKTTTKRVKAF